MYLWEVLITGEEGRYTDSTEDYTLRKDFRGNLGLVRDYEDDPALFTQSELMQLDFRKVVN